MCIRDRVTLDQAKVREIEDYYDRCAVEGANEHQIEESQKAVAHIDAIIGDPDRLQAVAEDFINHYETRVSEGATVAAVSYTHLHGFPGPLIVATQSCVDADHTIFLHILSLTSRNAVRMAIRNYDSIIPPHRQRFHWAICRDSCLPIEFFHRERIQHLAHPLFLRKKAMNMVDRPVLHI